MAQQEIIEQTLAYLKDNDSSEEAFNKQAMRLFEYQFRKQPSLSAVLPAKRENAEICKNMAEPSGCSDKCVQGVDTKLQRSGGN